MDVGREQQVALTPKGGHPNKLEYINLSRNPQIGKATCVEVTSVESIKRSAMFLRLCVALVLRVQIVGQAVI